MGLMDKIRDMFTEEVEVPEEQPIKKEVIQVEIPAPSVKKEEVINEEIVKKEEKKEEKVSSPIFFDDKDFASLEPPKVVKKVNSHLEKQRKKEEVKEIKKTFKPTPIISPIYGVLDKNYHKEDIKPKNNSFNSAYYNHKDVSIDDIRKKAYGTLEDDLEITLFGVQEEVVSNNEEEIDMFDELMDNEDKLGNTEKIDSSDLFNLIDSMYEKEDDDNGIC